MPTIHGEKAALRFTGIQGIMKLDELGIDKTNRSYLDQFLELREGALLLAGPTGSGKTTTLYATLAELAARNLNCVSIEDPVEMILPAVSQVSVNSKGGLDYSASLRAILRQDPDVILLGEIRDSASAQTALQAALTGHLLLTTVHARNAFEVLLRLKNFGLDNLTIAQACNLIICQRLVPKLCETCRVVDLQASNRYNTSIYLENGCNQCDYSGYSGRELVAESLWLDAGVCELIVNGAWDRLKEKLSKDGRSWTSMQSCLERMFLDGKISMRQFLSLCGTVNG